MARLSGNPDPTARMPPTHVLDFDEVLPRLKLDTSILKALFEKETARESLALQGKV